MKTIRTAIARKELGIIAAGEKYLTEEQQVGQKIRVIRKSKNLTQEQLAERISETCSIQSVSRWETGTDKMNMLTYFDVCAALDAEPNDIAPDWLLKKSPSQETIPLGYDNLNEENRAFIDKMIHTLLIQQQTGI